MKRLLLLPFFCAFLFSACEINHITPYLEGRKISEIGTQEEDNTILDELYQEILDLSQQETCNDNTDWEFVAIGSKPCGGHTGYIAYSVNIDVNDFLAKVQNYNEQQSTYNTKWGLLSDCSLPPVPTGVNCKDGKSVLVY